MGVPASPATVSEVAEGGMDVVDAGAGTAAEFPGLTGCPAHPQSSRLAAKVQAVAYVECRII